MRIRIRYPHLSGILHLPLVERLRHRASRRHIVGMGLAVVVMCSASTMAVNGEVQHLLPHFAWDACAYFLHGLGAVPIMKHAEPLWAIIIGDLPEEL